jgi:hypothetical protein
VRGLRQLRGDEQDAEAHDLCGVQHARAAPVATRSESRSGRPPHRPR